MKIVNARDRRMENDAAALPDVAGSVDMFLQSVKIGVIKKTLVSGYTKETTEWYRTRAVRQPFTAQMLSIRPEGERAWRWFTVHMLVDVLLHPDDVIVMHGLRMRVMEKSDYNEYGFVQYNCIEDYKNDRCS